MTFEYLPLYGSLGAAGALSLELLKLYEIRGKLAQKRFQALLRSPMWWAVFAGMVLASGFLAWVMHVDGPPANVGSVVVSGMAARSLARGLVAARVANTGVTLGEERSSLTVRDMF